MCKAREDNVLTRVCDSVNVAGRGGLATPLPLQVRLVRDLPYPPAPPIFFLREIW